MKWDEDLLDKNYSSGEEEIQNSEEEQDVKPQIKVDVKPELMPETEIQPKTDTETKIEEVSENEEVKSLISKEELEELLEKHSDNQIVLDKLDTIIDLLKNNQPKNDESEENDNNSIDEISKNQERNRGLLVQYIKQNAEFQQQVRTDMNKENETLKKELLGERLDPLLKGIAEIYGENYRLLTEGMCEDVKYQKQVSYMFESIQELLEEYDCRFITSTPGEERSPKYTKIKNPMVLTDDESLHRKVIQSFNPCIAKGNKVLLHEHVSIYKYDEQYAKEQAELKALEEAKKEEENLEEIQEEIMEPIEVDPVEDTETIEENKENEGEN
ncbi:MAG: hypothetical protein LUG46_08710 [Erysipelotrichaceae bacterium]|nr:hypothetical protein [Erysipelotrichaceae bacterium]